MSDFVKHIESRLGFYGRDIPAKTKNSLQRLTVGVQLLPEDGAFLVKQKRGYEMSVIYRHRGYCAPGDLEKLKLNFIREINHKIYGEFYGLLIELEQAIYEGEELRSREIIQAIFKEVGI